MDYSQYIIDLQEDFDIVQNEILQVDPSAAQNMGVHLTKILILTCASTYEQRLQEAYVNYAKQEAANYGIRPNRFAYDKNDKSVYQKFNFGHIVNSSDASTLKNYKNTLDPLKFFGEQFLNNLLGEIEADPEKEKQVNAFNEIFTMRNLIAHQTFVEFACNKIRNKSFGDIVSLHKDADIFVSYLVSKFN